MKPRTFSSAVRAVFCLGLALFLTGISGIVLYADLPSFGPPSRAETGADAATLKAESHNALMRVQIPFVLNEGQLSNQRVKFYANTFGGTVYVTDKGRIHYILSKYNGESDKRCVGKCVFEEYLVGARPVFPAGVAQLETKINWFVGNDPGKWKTNLRSFEWVNFGEVYQGIELRLRAYGDNVEKIFTLRPGADPALIKLRVDGVEALSISSKGELELTTPLGVVCFSAPVAYQTFESQPGRGVGEKTRRDPVRVAYRLVEGTIGFELGPYDKTRPLIIDPLVASTFLGGGSSDAIRAMVVDAQNNVYVAGYTASSDFPITNGCYTNYNGGNSDGFVAKLNNKLTTLSIATFLGGSAGDDIRGLVINNSLGAVYVAGYTESSDFPTTTNGIPFDSTYNGNRDVFVTRLNTNLSVLEASTFLGGTYADVAYCIALDANSNVYVAGYTASSNFPITNIYSTPYSSVFAGSNDVFVARFTASLSNLQASTFLGGTNDDVAYGIAVDSQIYLAGYTTSSGFPMTNASDSTYNGLKDVFIAKFSLDLTESNLLASTYLGGTNDDVAYGIARDTGTNLYLAGYTESADYPRNPVNNLLVPGYTNIYRGGKDAFFTVLSKDIEPGVSVSLFLGGTNDDVAYAVLVNSSGITNVYVTGYTRSANFPVVTNSYDPAANGGADVFLCLLKGGLTNLTASTYLGGNGDDIGYALALMANNNNVYVAGITGSGNFPVMPGAYSQTVPGSESAFISKFGAGLLYGTEKWRYTFSGGSEVGTPSFALDGKIYIGTSTGRLFIITAEGELFDSVQLSATKQSLIGSAPAVNSNGLVYVCSKLDNTLHAVSNAWEKWSFPVGLTLYQSPAIGLDNSIYISAWGRLWAIDALTGTTNWYRVLPATVGDGYASPVVGTNGQIHVVYIAGSSNAWLYTFSSSGDTNWIRTLAGTGESTPAIGSNGTIYVASSNYLFSFAANGDTNWIDVLTNSGVISASPSLDTNGVIYIGGNDGNFYSINPADGSTNWIRNLGGQVRSSASIGENGTIFVGCDSGRLYAFYPDGTTCWVYNAGASIGNSSPLLATDGTVYIGAGNSLRAVFGKERLGSSYWPTFQHDSFRTRNWATVALTLSAPTGVTASGEYADRVRVSWYMNPRATLYEIWRSPTNNSTSAVYIATSGSTSNYDDTGVSPGFYYYYWVKAKNSFTISDFSFPSARGGARLLTPSGIWASDGGIYTNRVRVGWTVPSGTVVVYKVYHDLSTNSGSASEIGSTAGTNFYHDAPGPTPGVSNFYWVRACNLISTSLFSSVDSGGIPPESPSVVTASSGASSNYVTVGWNTAPAATMYMVSRHTANDFSLASVRWLTNAFVFNDVNVTPFLPYYYWLQATNKYGLGTQSVYATGYRRMAPPLSVLATKGTFDDKVGVSWVIESTNPSSYEIFRSGTNDPSTAGAAIAEVTYMGPTSTNYEDQLIVRGLGYYYWVKAKNVYGVSDWSSSDFGGTPPIVPVGIIASGGTYEEKVLINWDQTVGASNYVVYRGGTFAPESAVVIGSTDSISYTDTSALQGVRYYYWVTASNLFGQSAMSSYNSGWRAVAAPATISASDGTLFDYIRVTWSVNPYASSYELWRNTNSSSASAVRIVNYFSTNTYNDTESIAGITYYYWAKAKTPSFTSVFSPYDVGYRALGNVDIGVSDFVFLPSVVSTGAHPFSVSFILNNYGDYDMVSTNSWVEINFYLSSSSVFGDNSQVLIGNYREAVPLSVGNQTAITVSSANKAGITIPPVALGYYYVYVYVNHTIPSAWIDTVLANNKAGRVGGAIKVSTRTIKPDHVNDLTGSGKSDLVLYYEPTGQWFIRAMDGSILSYGTVLGGPGFIPMVADFDNDGLGDLAVYEQVTGKWYIVRLDGTPILWGGSWGGPGYVPVWGDYDGDGAADLAVYRELYGAWYIRSVAGDVILNEVRWGGPGFSPVPGDFDGDGKKDLAMYQAGYYNWYILSVGGSPIMMDGVWGSGDGFIPVSGDFDGDGIADLAVYHQATGYWFILSVQGNLILWGAYWGGSGFTPVSGDYDGDGKSDLALYQEATGFWFIRTVDGTVLVYGDISWGGSGFSAVSIKPASNLY